MLHLNLQKSFLLAMGIFFFKEVLKQERKQVLQSLLGHASIRTTQIYGKITKKRKKAELAGLNAMKAFTNKRDLKIA